MCVCVCVHLCVCLRVWGGGGGEGGLSPPPPRGGYAFGSMPVGMRSAGEVPWQPTATGMHNKLAPAQHAHRPHPQERG